MSEAALSITVDDTDYLIRFSDLTAIDARDFRAQVGVPLAQVMATGAADLDVLAGLVWLERRRQEPGLKYVTVARSLTYDTEVEFTTSTEEEAGGDPEA